MTAATKLNVASIVASLAWEWNVRPEDVRTEVTSYGTLFSATVGNRTRSRLVLGVK